jgi:hypothetical protein
MGWVRKTEGMKDRQTEEGTEIEIVAELEKSKLTTYLYKLTGFQIL